VISPVVICICLELSLGDGVIPGIVPWGYIGEIRQVDQQEYVKLEKNKYKSIIIWFRIYQNQNMEQHLIGIICLPNVLFVKSRRKKCVEFKVLSKKNNTVAAAFM